MINLEIDRICGLRRNAITPKITLISIFNIYPFPAYLIQTRTRADLFGMIHKFSNLSMYRMRSWKFKERFEDSHHVKFPVMKLSSFVLDNKVAGWFEAILPIIKRNIGRRRKR